MKRTKTGVLIAIVGACSLGIALLAVHSDSDSATAASPPAPRYTVAGMADAPACRAQDMHLTPAADATPFDAAYAFSVVRSHYAAATQGASSIVVGKYRITSDALDQSRLESDTLAWVVTLDGVKWPSVGQSFNPPPGTPRPVFHQINFVIDAKTGTLLYSSAGDWARE